MDLMTFVEILIGTVAAFAVGSIWYTVLFGKIWRLETGITESEAQSNMLRTHGLAFLMIGVCS
jgi:hypothetical protein